MDTKALKDQIWTTRVSRINAERRLLKKESFIQGINIYYSCVTIIFSILSLKNSDNQLSLITTFMSICLFVTILYLNSQRYLERARDYRTNYTELHKLEMLLENENIEASKVEEIRLHYCDLLNLARNHIPYDYYCTVSQSSGAYRDKRWKFSLIIRFFCGKVWRDVVMATLVALPFVLYYLCGVV